MIIGRTLDAVNKILHITQYNEGGTLRLIGKNFTTETATLWIPAVTPNYGADIAITAFDPDNEDHWTLLTYGDAAFEINAANTALGVPYRGLMRVQKSAHATNAFGVGYYDYF